MVHRLAVPRGVGVYLRHTLKYQAFGGPANPELQHVSTPGYAFDRQSQGVSALAQVPLQQDVDAAGKIVKADLDRGGAVHPEAEHPVRQLDFRVGCGSLDFPPGKDGSYGFSPRMIVPPDPIARMFPFLVMAISMISFTGRLSWIRFHFTPPLVVLKRAPSPPETYPTVGETKWTEVSPLFRVR